MGPANVATASMEHCARSPVQLDTLASPVPHVNAGTVPVAIRSLAIATVPQAGPDPNATRRVQLAPMDHIVLSHAVARMVANATASRESVGVPKDIKEWIALHNATMASMETTVTLTATARAEVVNRRLANVSAGQERREIHARRTVSRVGLVTAAVRAVGTAPSMVFRQSVTAELEHV